MRETTKNAHTQMEHFSNECISCTWEEDCTQRAVYKQTKQQLHRKTIYHTNNNNMKQYENWCCTAGYSKLFTHRNYILLMPDRMQSALNKQMKKKTDWTEEKAICIGGLFRRRNIADRMSGKRAYRAVKIERKRVCESQ